MFAADDTIVAVATPPGRGGIGVVRLSGPDATRIAAALVRTPHHASLQPRVATFARIVDPGGPAAAGGDRPTAPDGGTASAHRVIDQVVATWFPRPKSYTGDDVVEISAHGSPVLLRRIVELCLAAGARLAEPGEFTLRAYLNGRVDLVQAEAVADLVDAVTPLQARAAMDQLEGTLTEAMRAIDERLLDLTARLEASLDFPDEGFHFISPEDVAAEVSGVRAELAALAAAGRRGRLIREGRLVVIAGPPNAGKSSLFNALIGSARAIVTDVAGTTRDLLTERVDVHGVPLTLVDTAGLRAARDAIEAEGIARAQQARSVAALTLLVLDGAVPLDAAALGILDESSGPVVVVVNKSDVGEHWPLSALGAAATSALRVSAVTGAGLDALRLVLAGGPDGRADAAREVPAISNVRHLQLVERAAAHLDAAESAIGAGATEEVVLVELTAARQALEELTGRREPDDLLQHIFARFCVGK